MKNSAIIFCSLVLTLAGFAAGLGVGLSANVIRQKPPEPVCKCTCPQPSYICTCPTESAEKSETTPAAQKPFQTTVGQRIIVTGWEWIEVITDPSGEEMEGGSCGIDPGGYITIVAFLDDHEAIIRYFTQETHTGSGCNSGVLGVLDLIRFADSVGEAEKLRARSEKVHKLLEKISKEN